MGMTLQTLFNEIGASHIAEEYYKDFSKYRIDGIDLYETDHIIFCKGNYVYDCKAVFYECYDRYCYNIERAHPGQLFMRIEPGDMKRPPETACYIASVLARMANYRESKAKYNS